MPSARRVTLVTNRSSPTSWHLLADQVGQLLPAVQVVFGHAVLDRDDRIARRQIGEIFRLLGTRAGLALAAIDVLAVLEEFGRRAIERQHDVLARPCSRPCSIALHDEFERGSGRRQVRREAALVADIGVVAGLLQSALAACGRFPRRSAAPRQKLSAPTGMIMNSWKSIGLSACTPPLMMFIIGTGSVARRGAADIAIERQVAAIGGGLGHGQRDAENGVGAEPALVRRAVELDHGLVDLRPAPRHPCRPSASKISPLTASTAFSTPLPR